jgi:hypothetical protein
VRVKVAQGVVRNVHIVAVGSPPGFAKPGSPPDPLSRSPLATGGMALAAAGVVTSVRGRRTALIALLVVGMAGTAALIGIPHAGAAAPGDVPFPPQPGIVTRAQWGADESLRLHACPNGPDYANPQLVVLHHTATTNSYSPADSAAIVRGIYVYYIQGRGYCDHGYNFLVDKYGTIFEGRYGGIDRGVIGAHATGFNTGTIGIAMIGDNTSVPPTGATFNSLVNLISWKFTIHQINPYVPVATRGAILNPIIGHRDAGAISHDPTSCPGQAGYEIIPRLITTVQPRVAFGWPYGALEIARRQPNAINVSGWTADPDTPNPIQVHVYIDGVGAAIGTAGDTRPDIGQLFPTLGANHGFNLTVGTTQAPHFVCVWAISVGNGGNRMLGCAYLSGDTLGSLDNATRQPGALEVRGWTIDPDTTASIPVHAYVDGVGAAIGTANVNRPDIAAFMPGYGALHGYDFSVPVTGDRTVCTYGISTRGKANPVLGCVRTSGSPRGALDSVSRSGDTVRVQGWALDPDAASSIPVHVYVDGVGRAIGTANGARPDVGAVFAGWGDDHGYDITVSGLGPGPHLVCTYGISIIASPNSTLGCRAV